MGHACVLLLVETETRSRSRERGEVWFEPYPTADAVKPDDKKEHSYSSRVSGDATAGPKLPTIWVTVSSYYHGDVYAGKGADHGSLSTDGCAH